MRLTEYGRNPDKRKEYVHQPDLLLVGVDVSKAKHSACLGTPTTVSCRKLECTHTREGFKRFEQTLRAHLVKNPCQRLLIAMEPSGIDWQALYERLKSCGYGVCLVHCPAVRNHRKTRQDGTRKTDAKDAYSLFDLLRQGTFFLPVERDPELQAAYRLMRRHMALKKWVSQLRHHLRAAIHLTFPELHLLVKDLTQPTALRFWQGNPTPTSMLRNGQRHCLETWQPRSRCGQWRPEKFQQLYDLAQHRIGLSDPDGIDAFAIKALAHDVADALATQQLWLDKAIELLAPRPDFQGLMPWPRSGQPTAAALLTAMGDLSTYTNGKQLVTLAGLDIRLFASGSRIRKLPNISHVGSAYLRYGLYHYALRLVAPEPHCTASSQRRKHQSPGKGAGQRALIAVCDKTIRMISRILTDAAPYDPKKDQSIAEYYAAQRKAA
jgi:transposase